MLQLLSSVLALLVFLSGLVTKGNVEIWHSSFAMTIKQAERLLGGFLEDVTSTLGFQRIEPLTFSRPANEATALLAFPCRIDPRGPACFVCMVCLRFEPLERYLRGEAAKPTTATVSMPLHLLRENKKFTEWQFYTTDDLEKLRAIILSDLREHALPFIEQYSKLTEVRRKLESSKPSDWFILGPEQRLNVLAAILFVQGDKAGALKILDDALLERKGALPAKWLPIERVRKRLAEAG